MSAGDLYSIVKVAADARVKEVQFGTRQQMIFTVTDQYFDDIRLGLQQSGILFEVNDDCFPNIVSSYVSENVFANSGWVSEGVYKDILDGFDYKPGLKINIVDRDQTFVPFFTGNINFISSGVGNYWYLYIRFPKSRILYRWNGLIYSGDIPAISREIEHIIFSNRGLFCEQLSVDGNALYSLIQTQPRFIYGHISEELRLPEFTLPYYEGFNRYENKSWLGIYRRDEKFDVSFLKDICMICMQTKIGQLHITPWKSIIVKGIEHADRKFWDHVLGKYRINVRHASNELNWQIEDNCSEGLSLKRYLVRQFDKEDVRTFGLCFALKTQPNSGLFGSIIIRKVMNRTINQRKNLDRYDILYTKDFNPNSKDYILFRENIEKDNLSVYLISLCKYFYSIQSKDDLIAHEVYRQETVNDTPPPETTHKVFQCTHCLTIYDRQFGDQENRITPGTEFTDIGTDYECQTCGAPKDDFVEIIKKSLIV